MTRRRGLVLRAERRLPAARAVVYEALTDPGRLRRWWGPRGFTTTSVRFHPQVGALYRIGMQPPAGDPFHLEGQFREVDAPARLAYTFRWDPPHADDRETVVVLALEERGGETLLRLTQGEFATDERYALHEAGWRESFERLERVLAEASG